MGISRELRIEDAPERTSRLGASIAIYEMMKGQGVEFVFRCTKRLFSRALSLSDRPQPGFRGDRVRQEDPIHSDDGER